MKKESKKKEKKNLNIHTWKVRMVIYYQIPLFYNNKKIIIINNLNLNLNFTFLGMAFPNNLIFKRLKNKLY